MSERSGNNKLGARAKLQARIDQNVADARAVRDNPRAIGGILRRGFVRLWKLRGGGFYGLGWVVCFFVLQFQALSQDVSEAQGIADFASNWLLEKLLSFGLETFLNFGLAFAWPGFLISFLGGWGIALLVAGFILIDGKLRPLVLANFPELRPEPEQTTNPTGAADQTTTAEPQSTSQTEETSIDERR